MGRTGPFLWRFPPTWGGSRFEHIRDVTTDNEGNIYVTGGTESPNYPVTEGAYQSLHNPGEPDSPSIDRFDVFVAKFDPGGRLVWSTFLGGPNYDRAYAIEVDSGGCIYVAGPDLEGQVLRRTDGVIDFDWGEGSPDPALEADTFSARRSGRIKPRCGDEHTFLTTSDDGVRLWVNGELLIDNWGDHYPSEDRASITLHFTRVRRGSC